MQLVLLAGELGEKYGQKHEYYNLQTPADAIKLLCINYPALKAELMQAHQNGVGYRVIQGGAAMGYDELQLPFGSKPLLVVPVIMGSGGDRGGFLPILIGVGLVAAAVITGGTSLAFTAAGFGAAAGITTVSTALSLSIIAGNIGVALILAGTASLLSPQPQLPKANRGQGSGSNVRGNGPDGITRGASGNQSYAFTGPANTVGTGATLPVIYGRVITGSHLIAANLDVTDNSDPLQTATQAAGINTIKINSEPLTRELKDCGGIKSRRGNFHNSLRSTEENKKVYIGKIFGPGQPQPLAEEAEYKGSNVLRFKMSADKRKNIDVIFKISNGLSDFVAGNGSTKIDGFITYEITLSLPQTDGEPEIASARITVQGLTEKSQEFVYGHRLQAPRVDGSANEKLRIDVKIIEAGVRNNATFELVGYGYKLLDAS